METVPKPCPWCGDDPLYRQYHDTEWGVPSTDERHLFEMIILEGAQAGLSWITVLKRREHYRRAFANFDPEQVANYGEHTLESLLENPGLIRHRAKLRSAVSNARAFCELQETPGGAAQWLWGFVDGRPLQNRFSKLSQVPAETNLSKTLSREMKRRGFSFFGPTIAYAYMQAVGMVNDHLLSCPRYSECAHLKPSW